mmetsp:Transcript_18670/g.42462  ORF Transcript_18670/g.42462 Transcript_18670/m.42462 type:complete len:99 (-) Transcript_18670:245-541(-)
MASKADAGAIANAIQEANILAAAQLVEDSPALSGKSKSRKKLHDDPRLYKCRMTGASKEDAERARRSGRFDMGADEGSPDSDSSSEKKHQEECRRAAA